MSNEDFQKKVLDSLKSIDERLSKLEQSNQIIINQTVNLTEFKQTVKEVGERLSKIS